MQVKEIMTTGVECARPAASIRDAAIRMRDLSVGSLPVCDHRDRLVGIVTDRDLVIRALAEGVDPQTTRVDEVMTSGVEYCFEDQDVAKAADLMKQKQIRRLLVLNREKKLKGIVSLGDVAVKGRNDRISGDALEQVSQPASPIRRH